jgi:3'-phosphoadenosine 5'-phosphosulfate sulfotransferase (PAPS reductase)/FAD synthetase
MRTVCWFSCGAASAVATKLALSEGPAVVAYTDTNSEHPDNDRFLAECEIWYGQEILRLRSKRYEDIWQVFEERRFLVSAMGALCTAEMKKKVRYAFEEPDDIQIFGFTSEEKARAERFMEQNPGVHMRAPLIERGLTKQDCLALLTKADIEIPAMYKLGYQNNNCIGCVKGGMGYWNKIRRDFPVEFKRMAELERKIGRTVNRDKDGQVWLDELDPDRGRYEKELSMECSPLCALVDDEVA